MEGIEKLAPGHWLEWEDGRVSSEAYWSLPFGGAREVTLGAAKEELDHLLGEAVREHLLSDVPLGVWLSGEIGSSTILHYAAQASSSKLKTLSISFRGRTFDETPYIRDVVNQYGTDHEQFDLNPTENLTGAIEEFAYYSDEPTADAGALPIWFLSKLSKTKVTVTLSGEGGDEVFGGYLTYRANEMARIARHVPPGLLRFGGAFRARPVSDDKMSLEYKLKRFLEGCLMPCEQAHVYWNGTFSAAQAERPHVKAPGRARPRPGACAKKLPGDGIRPYMWFGQIVFLIEPHVWTNAVARQLFAQAPQDAVERGRKRCLHEGACLRRRKSAVPIDVCLFARHQTTFEKALQFVFEADLVVRNGPRAERAERQPQKPRRHVPCDARQLVRAIGEVAAKNLVAALAAQRYGDFRFAQF